MGFFLGEMPNEEEKSDIDVFIGNVFVLGFVVDTYVSLSPASNAD